jgi:hypothetical protein
LGSGGTALKHLRDLKHINDSNPVEVHIKGTDAYNEYNNLLDTVTGELAQFYQLPKTDSSIKSMTSTLGALIDRNASILRQAKSMSEKLDSYEQTWKNAAPSKAYEAPMPKIDDDARAARAELVPSKQQPQQQTGQPAQAPPVNLLKEGVHTTFKNGQTWSLQGGKPVQIQSGGQGGQGGSY